MELQKCSRCHTSKLLELFKIRANTGERYKICQTCCRAYKCDLCNLEFNTSYDLKTHIKFIHEDIRDFPCDQCELKCHTAGDLKKHIKFVHDKIKDCACDRCDYKCGMAYTLKKHIKFVHEDIRDFPCDQCELKCHTANDLKKHIKCVHDKIRDFECDQCDYKGSTSTHLKDHKKSVHDKIKDCSCDQCDYKCYLAGDLKKHIKFVHENIRDFPCDQCDLKCHTANNLKHHLKICTSGLPMSGGELACCKALELLNIPYKQEVYAIENTLLRFDFEVFVNDEIRYFEYDGPQHFQPVRWGGMSLDAAYENLKAVQKRDRIKDEWCKTNNKKMMRIPYTEFENIYSILKTWIESG